MRIIKMMKISFKMNICMSYNYNYVKFNVKLSLLKKLYNIILLQDVHNRYSTEYTQNNYI